jgi:hypothetical protein
MRLSSWNGLPRDTEQLVQKAYLFSLQIVIPVPQANAISSVGYTDTVLFLAIGKPDTYQLKVYVSR